MPLLLRKIRKARWHNPDWVPQGGLQADALRDIETQGNKLSLWHVEDDKSNLEQVVVALATTSDSLSNLDYVLLEEQRLSEVGITIECSGGNTPLREANTSWHRDLVQLTTAQVFNLATLLMVSGERVRVPERRVSELIVERVRGGKIDVDRLRPLLKERVEKLLPGTNPA